MRTMSKPLTSFTKKDKQTAHRLDKICVNKLFRVLSEHLPVLVPPDVSKEFFVWVNTSEEGFEVILEQNNNDGH